MNYSNAPSIPPTTTIRSQNPTDPTNLGRSTSTASLVPLSARTRSMTRLSILSDGPLSKLDRKTGKATNTALAPRKVLGERNMNVKQTQQEESEGLKRKSTLGMGGGKLKRVKVDRSVGNVYANTNVKRDDDRAPLNRIQMPNAHTPVTPTKRTDITPAPKPTPARVLLAQPDAPDTSTDDSPEPSRFVARPPTPPRPHLNLGASTSRPPSHSEVSDVQMEIDAPPLTPPKTAATTTKSLSQSFKAITLAPTTPRTAAQTPRRVMASVSKFRSGASPRGGLSPIKSPLAGSGRPTLDSVMERREAKLTQTTLTGMIRSTGDFGLAQMQAAAEDTKQRAIVDHVVVSPSLVSAAAVETPSNAEEDVQMEQSIEEETVNDVPPIQPKPSMMPLPLPKRNASSQNLSAMPPPSRIPSAIRKPTVTPAKDAPKRLAAITSTSSTSALGRGHPSTTPTSSSRPSKSIDEPIRRKPSYPSSLGSGPLARPRDRMVSGPVMFHQRDGTLASQKDEPPKPKQSPRSVSEPVARSRPGPSLSVSTNRREGLSLETSKSIAGLSDALSKLKAKKVEGNAPRASLTGSTSSKTLHDAPGTIASSSHSATTVSHTTSRVTSIHRPRQSVAMADSSMEVDSHAGDRSLAAILCSTDGGACLKGVVAFVDVRTADGEDANPIFTEMLRSLGARVLSRLTESVTHIVYKSGKPTTLTWYRKQEEDERPHIVGCGWVMRSKAKGERLDEGPFVVDIGEEDIFQKRRKSMEPKALASMANQMSLDSTFNIASMRRKSLMYAPRISSPLKKAYQRPSDLYEE